MVSLSPGTELLSVEGGWVELHFPYECHRVFSWSLPGCLCDDGAPVGSVLEVLFCDLLSLEYGEPCPCVVLLLLFGDTLVLLAGPFWAPHLLLPLMVLDLCSAQCYFLFLFQFCFLCALPFHKCLVVICCFHGGGGTPLGDRCH